MPRRACSRRTAGRSISTGRRCALPRRERARRIGYLPQVGEVAWDLSVEALVGARPPAGTAALHRAHAEAATMWPQSTRRWPPSTLLDCATARSRACRAASGPGPCWRACWPANPAGSSPTSRSPRSTLPTRSRCSPACARQAAAGHGVVLVLHDLALAMNHADRVLVLDRGALVADGPPERGAGRSDHRAGLGRHGALAWRARRAGAEPCLSAAGGPFIEP